MTSIQFTKEELLHLRNCVLAECLNQRRQHIDGNVVEKHEHTHHIDVLSTVLLHITKALELEKGNENGNT